MSSVLDKRIVIPLNNTPVAAEEFAYDTDERFKANIDRHGEGTADFMQAAIKEYCR